MRYGRMLAICLAISIAALGAWLAQARHGGTLIVFAAASLTDAFEDLALAFETENPGTDVLFNFGSSSDLAAQLAAGAPADVFASANPRQMEAVVDAGRVTSPPTTFARNRLVLIVPADNPAGIDDLHDLANDDVLIVLAAPDVPARDYANVMLDRLVGLPAYGADYRDAVLANVASEERNVRQVAAKVALGEADAGIVYFSDVTPDIMSDVLVRPIPAPLNTVGSYPIAVIDDSSQPELAQAFVDFALADAGQAIMTDWNFMAADLATESDSVVAPTDGTLTVDGQVLNPLMLTHGDLQDYFSPHVISIGDQTDGETGTTTYTGALLRDVVTVVQPDANAGLESALLTITGANDDQAILTWDEVDPASANGPVLLAYWQNGTPINDATSGVRLVNPSERADSRIVRGVTNVSVRDAAPSSR